MRCQGTQIPSSTGIATKWTNK